MSISKENKTQLITDYKVHDSDTGSPEVQIAILTHRIRALTEHAKMHRQDHQAKRGLLIMVGKRKSLLSYLKDKSVDRYKEVIKRLEIRK